MKSFQKFKVVCATSALLLSSSSGYAETGPFAALAGSWSGNGTIQVADGGKERIRCRSTNEVNSDASNLRQNLRCASDSYRFELSSDITARSGTVTGSWRENTRDLNGTLEGRGNTARFDLLISANGFSATLSLVTSGNRQSIEVASKSELRAVSINLVRSQ